ITVLQASTAANASSIVVLTASTAANASSIVVLTASTAANASAIAVLEAASTHPLNLTAFRQGTVTGGDLFWLWPVGVSTHIGTQSQLGTGLANVAGAGAATDISIKHSASVDAVGSTIGTVKWAASSGDAEGTVDVSTAAVVAPGEMLYASVLNADGTIADVAFTITASVAS
ncbi:MAG: hypothetical protein ACXABY_18785, partial [Candidatus Thorarchaeota archaeon]